MPSLLAEAGCPVRLIRGERDPMQTLEQLRALDPGAADLAGLGHSAMVEDPAAVWAATLGAGPIRRCRADERETIAEIINGAAERYRGAIPDDCWHEPYMSPDALDREIGQGVEFWGYEAGGELVGVMGVQPVKDVILIRHAYVRPSGQGKGIGSRLLAHLTGSVRARVLIGTWADASWAIGFYQRHGFELAGPADAPALLGRYWNIPDRQAEVSVVLVGPEPVRP